MNSKITYALIVLLLTFQLPSRSQALITDIGFGNSGVVTSPLPIYHPERLEILRQTGDKMVMCGTDYDIGTNAHYIDMYRTDMCGNLDSSFGINGSMHFTFDQRNYGADFALQPDEKILCAGMQASSNAGSQQFPCISRFTRDGLPDSTFGSAGSTVITNYGPYTFSNLFLMSDGKIICSTGTFTMRFSSDGQVDTSFGVSGAFTIPIPSSFSFTYGGSSVMRNDGVIISEAAAFNGTDVIPLIMAFDTLGNLDSTYGTDGHYTQSTPIAASNNYIMLQSTGKTVIVTQTYPLHCFRLTTNGELDTTFGTNGYIDFVASSPPSSIREFVPLRNDRFMVIYSENGISDNMFKVYDSEGVLVSNFSINGNTTTFAPNAGWVGDAIELPNGEMTIVGSDLSSLSVLRFILENSSPTITATDTILHSNINSASFPTQWYLDGNLIAGANDSIYTCTQNGTYTVEVTDNWNCVKSDSYVFTSTGITQNELSGVSVYPIPANNTLTISAPEIKGNFKIALQSLVGSIVFEEEFSNKAAQIDVSKFAKGTYQLQITSNEGRVVKKVILQ